MQDSINKDLEELKNKHTETKNTTTEIKNTLEGINFLLQRIFPTQGLNLGLLHCRQTLYHLSHQGMAVVTICSDFGAQNNKSLSLFPLFLHLFSMK